MLKIVTFHIVRIVLEEEGACAAPDSLVVVGLVDVLDRALGDEALALVSFAKEVAYFQREGPALVVADHGLAEED